MTIRDFASQRGGMTDNSAPADLLPRGEGLDEGQTGFRAPLAYTAPVRRRLIIGAIAAVVIGVAAYMLSQPEEGTVAWHKMEYLRAQDDLAGRTLPKQVKRLIQRLRFRIGFVPKPTIATPVKVKDGELQKHQSALIQLGFLEAKTIYISQPLGARVDSIVAETRTIIPEKRRQFAQLSTAPTLTVPSFVTIVAPREDIPVWEKLIRKADVKASLEAKNRPAPMRTTNRSLMLGSPGELPVAAGLDEMLREKPDVRRSAQ